MDNITHSLIGITAAQGLGRKAEPRLLAALTWTAILSSNFPDADFVLGWAAGGGPLGYLLQHRGYTHTLLATLPMAAISGWVGARIAGLGNPFRPENRRRAAALFGMAVLGGFLHIGADAWNDYGVHPFYPFDRHWYYGDFIFILEPLLIFALLPLAFARAGWGLTRAGWGLTGLALLGLVWFGPFTTWPVALAITLWAALNSLIQRLHRGALPAALAALAVLAMFATASSKARGLVNQSVQADAFEKQEQLVSSPAPGNPFCWRVINVGLRGEQMLVERLGAVSLLPGVFKPETCVLGLHAERTAPILPSTIPGNENVYWAGEFRGSLAELVPLIDTNCRMKALMKFARVPFWVRDPQPGGETLAGDLRYDREKGKSWAKIDLQLNRAGQPCPQYIPNWAPNFKFRYLK
jgi:inner membrane protein